MINSSKLFREDEFLRGDSFDEERSLKYRKTSQKETRLNCSFAKFNNLSAYLLIPNLNDWVPVSILH